MTILFIKSLKNTLVLCIILISLLVNIQLTQAQQESTHSAISTQTQSQLAAQLFDKITATDDYDLETIERLYKQIIKQCPDTEQAQQSYWLLSSLYRFAWDTPKWQSIQHLLQQFLNKYPHSDDTSKIRKRLLNAYASLHEWDKAIGLYNEIFINKPYDEQDINDHAYYYAEALRMNNQLDKAIIWYQHFLDNSRDSDDLNVIYTYDTLEVLRTFMHSSNDAKPTIKNVSTIETAQLYMQQGNQLLQKGDYTRAIQAYKKSLNKQKNKKLADRIKRLEMYLEFQGDKKY